MHTQACTLKHRPAVLPQDAVFQLFKPQLKLAAQPLEGKAGRIPVITVWLVEWLQLASLSLEDLHTYKKAQGSKVQLQEIFLYYSDTSQEVKKGLTYVWKVSKSFSPKILCLHHNRVITVKIVLGMKWTSFTEKGVMESVRSLYSICMFPPQQQPRSVSAVVHPYHSTFNRGLIQSGGITGLLSVSGGGSGDCSSASH